MLPGDLLPQRPRTVHLGPSAKSQNPPTQPVRIHHSCAHSQAAIANPRRDLLCRQRGFQQHVAGIGAELDVQLDLLTELSEPESALLDPAVQVEALRWL